MHLIPGKYILSKSENFDEYLKACGVSYVLRKIAAVAVPTTEIAQNGDIWTLKTVIPFKTVEIKFKSGEEFDEEPPDGTGRKARSTITIEGNKFTHIIRLLEGDVWEDIREFTQDEMHITLKTKDVVCTRIYTRMP